MWQVTAKYGRRKGRSWPVLMEALVIGRNPTCTITLNDPLVSREHCSVRLEGNRLVLQDLGSANATLVNGEPVATCTLHAGDEFAVGEATFVVTQSLTTDPASDTPIGLHTTQHLSPRNSGFWRPFGTETESLTVAELAVLHRFTNAAAACKNEDELFSAIVASINDRCSPAGLFLRSHSGLRVHPSSHVLDDELQGTIEVAMTERKSRPSFKKYPSVGTADTIVAALPIQLGERFLGLLGCVYEAATPTAIEPDVQFALCVTRVLAPFLQVFAGSDPVSRPEKLEQAAAYLGESEGAREARRLIALAASADIPVLIQGETGTGKELAAELIHQLSPHASGPFVATNCAAISEDLFESEVFGHVKGAFTGALANRAGLLREASGGHLLLDEISDLSARNQSKLLRAIETQRFRPVGGNSDVEVDFGVIAASNCDLWEEVEAGRFRADLYYRLAGIELYLPPLSERATDVPLLADAFAHEYAAAQGVAAIEFEPAAIEYLQSLPWFGNVRELRNYVNRAAAMTSDRRVSRASLERIRARHPGRDREELRQIDDVEREHIERVLAEHGGRIQDAARTLGIHRNTLSKKLRRYRETG